jgi:hypothetical protein
MEQELYQILKKHKLTLKKREEVLADLLILLGVSDWVAVSERLPEVGVEVWAVTYSDNKVRKIVWGTGDEAFYEHWKVLNRPEPPCR